MPSTLSLQAITSKRGAAAALVAAMAAAAFAVSGCGDAVPTDAVATVGGTVIPKDTFNHWYVSAAMQQNQQQSGARPGSLVIPDPPDFKKCVAQEAKQPVPTGSPKPKASDLKAQCQQQYTQLRDQTMQFLLSAEWLTQEAKARGVTASDKEVRTTFEQQKQQAFPQPANYQRFLQTSGQTEADLLYRVRLSVITNKLQKQISNSAGNVTNADVQAYYNQNKQRFAQPETRDLLVVLNAKQARAAAALSALKSGQPWAKVAKQYSTDAASAAQGGKLPGVTRGQQERTFDTAIFKAPTGAIEGPIKTQFGYYVFRVTKVTPAHQQTLAEAAATIRNLLKSQRTQTALNNFVKDFQTRYKKMTKCQKGYEIQQQCSNAPKQTSTTPASGGAPQGAGGAQGAPQQGAPPQGAGAPQSGAPPQGGAPQSQP